WKPLQPPPITATRRPKDSSIPSCWRVSLTISIALAVRVTGWTGAAAGAASGVAFGVVASKVGSSRALRTAPAGGFFPAAVGRRGASLAQGPAARSGGYHPGVLRALLFDFNALLVDDEPLHFRLFRRVLG